MMYVNQTGAGHAAIGLRRVLVLLGLLLALGGCGGGNDKPAANQTNGTAVVGLTDAPGDFLTYSVDVQSIKLVHADGRVVETLPLSTRVDFARYTDMTEFVSAATVPLGAYKEAFVTLDYSHAQIAVQGNNGEAVPVPVGQIKDDKGQPVTSMQMQVRLDRNVPVALGLPRYILFDFNLAKTNAVTLNTDNTASIVVTPTLVATVDKASPRLHRLRGPLKSVNLADGSYDLYVRPYFRRMAGKNADFGEFHVYTGNNTVFEIDGKTYQGEQGLAALASTPQYTAAVAIGHLHLDPLHFDADEVRAGSSVPGGDLDAVKGSVIARSGNTLTLRGATLIRSDGTAVFNDNVILEVNNSTVVTRELSTAHYTIADISVGQRLTAFGTVTDPSSASLTLSATAGYVRMELSQVRGQVTSMPTMAGEPVVMNLIAINGRDPSIYQFDGTQASASSYDVDPGKLDLAPFATGDDLAARGFPTPFSNTGPLDFTATSLIQYPAASP